MPSSMRTTRSAKFGHVWSPDFARATAFVAAEFIEDDRADWPPSVLPVSTKSTIASATPSEIMTSTEPVSSTMWAVILCLSEIALRDARETGRDPFAGEVGRFANAAVLRNANRKLPIAHPKRQATGQLDARLGNQIAARDSHVDCAFGTQHRNVVGPQKRHFDRHIANAREQASLLPAVLEPGRVEHLGRHLGQAAFARNANAKVVSHEMISDCGFGLRIA